MSNFAFLPDTFSTIAESAARAEGHIMSDPRAACFHVCRTLKRALDYAKKSFTFYNNDIYSAHNAQ